MTIDNKTILKTAALRPSVKVRIEQQRRKPAAAPAVRASVLAGRISQLGSFRRKEWLVTASAITTLAACAVIYAQAQTSWQPLESLENQEVVSNFIPDTHSDSPPEALEILPLAAAEPIFPKQTQITVGKGDTLIELLTDTGVSMNEAHEAVAAIRKIYDPRRINSGQEVDITLEAAKDSPKIPSLAELKMPISGTATIELHKIEDGKFVVKKVEVPVTAFPTYTRMEIKGSFYQTARQAGLSPQMIMELMKAYSYDVDFQRDVQRGHSLEVVVDVMKRDDGTVVGTTNLRYAKLDLGRKKIAMYRYTDKSGHTAYYNEKGESLKKALLRTPIDGARISSGFGMRKHPVLGYNKMHRGMDFAASTGTPIYAAGDGVVEEAGSKGSYGKYVRIKHNGKYSTAYAHASRIAKGIRPGARVKQGQVIAYVGTTGRSTGPHLHYEVLANGQQVNPGNIQFKTGNVLAGKELKEFKSMVGDIHMVMNAPATPASTKVASKTAAKTAKNGA